MALKLEDGTDLLLENGVPLLLEDEGVPSTIDQWTPEAAGPRTIRQLYHWVWRNLSSLASYLSTSFDVLLEQIADRTRWMGFWQPNTTYAENDQVLDEGWLMIANTDTNERPVPSFVGEPYWLSGLDDTPAWATNNVTANVVHAGQRYTLTDDGIIAAIRFWVETANPDVLYGLWLVRNPTSPVPDVTQIYAPQSQDSAGWQIIPSANQLIVGGEEFSLVRVTQDVSSSSSFSGEWAYLTPPVGVPPASGQVIQVGGSMDIHYIDNNAGDRTLELQGLVPGDTIQMGGGLWTVLFNSDQGTYAGLQVVPTSGVGSVGVQTFNFTTFSAASIDYVSLTDYYLANAQVEGLFSSTGFNNIAADQNAYGVDLFVQRLQFSDDWDVQSYSGGDIARDQPINITRNRWRGNWEAGDYYTYDQVLDNGWLMIANKFTNERAGPVPVGDKTYVYSGAAPDASTTAKQIIFGNRYTAPPDVAYQIDRYRIYTTIGNVYRVFSVTDPTGAGSISELLSFTATTDGWAEFSIDPIIIVAGASFDLVSVVSEPDPTPTTFTGNWNYQTPNNAGIPGAGNISHANRAPSEFRINKTDDDGGDRSAELGALTVGDIIDWGNGGTRWAIQSITDNGTWFNFGVSPATQESPDGVNLFTFETVTATPITRMEDVGWWTANSPGPDGGTVAGLYIEDDSYENIVPNGNAYGTDVQVQRLNVSDDWDIQAISGGGGSTGVTRVREVQLMAASSYNDQDPAGLGVPLQVEFGGVQSVDEFDLSAAGAFTCKIADQYVVSLRMVVGRSNAGSELQLYMRMLVDGVQVGDSLHTIVDNQRIEMPLTLYGVLDLDVGQVITFEIIRDTDGANNGGLRAGIPDVPGWASAPSARLTIARSIVE